MSEESFNPHQIDSVPDHLNSIPAESSGMDVSQMMIHGFLNHYKDIARQAVLREKERLEALLETPDAELLGDDIHDRLAQISETLKNYDTE
jgi:hypothetical protein